MIKMPDVELEEYLLQEEKYPYPIGYGYGYNNLKEEEENGK